MPIVFVHRVRPRKASGTPLTVHAHRAMDLDELDPIPADPDGAQCYLLACVEWAVVVETGQLPPPCLN